MNFSTNDIAVIAGALKVAAEQYRHHATVTRETQVMPAITEQLERQAKACEALLERVEESDAYLEI